MGLCLLNLQIELDQGLYESIWPALHLHAIIIPTRTAAHSPPWFWWYQGSFLSMGYSTGLLSLCTLGTALATSTDINRTDFQRWSTFFVMSLRWWMVLGISSPRLPFSLATGYPVSMASCYFVPNAIWTPGPTIVPSFTILWCCTIPSLLTAVPKWFLWWLHMRECPYVPTIVWSHTRPCFSLSQRTFHWSTIEALSLVTFCWWQWLTFFGPRWRVRRSWSRCILVSTTNCWKATCRSLYANIWWRWWCICHEQISWLSITSSPWWEA
jgi:hypothetical protein